MDQANAQRASFGGAARDAIDAEETIRGIGSVRARRAAIGIDVAETPLNIRSRDGPPSAPHPTLPLLRIVVRHALAVGGRDARKAIVAEVVAALPANAVRPRRRVERGARSRLPPSIARPTRGRPP